MDYIITHAADLWTILASIITTASLIVKLTPTDVDNKIVGFLEKLALNRKA